MKALLFTLCFWASCGLPATAQSYWAKEYFQRGELELYLGDYKQAIIQYDLAIGVWSSYAEAYFSRGRVYLLMKDLNKAAQDFHRVTLLQPQKANAYFYLGAVFHENQELEHAITHYSQALDLDTMFAIAYNYRAEAYRLQGLSALSIRDYQKAIQYGGKEAPLYFGRGKCNLSLQKPQEAAQDFTQAIALEPRKMLYYQYRLEASFLANDYTQTAEDIEYILKIKGDSTEQSYKSLLVFCYLKAKDWQKGVQAMERLPAQDKQTAQFYVTRGNCYYELRETEKALQDYQSLLALTPDSLAYRRKCVMMYFGGKDYENTIVQASHYLKSNPKDAEIWYWRGLSHFLLKHEASFKPDLAEAQKLGYKREDMDLRVQPFVKKKRKK